MSGEPFLANIVGIPHIPMITEVNVRSGPAVSRKPMFRIPVGTRGLRIKEVNTDAEGRNLNGKVYQWFRLTFPDGRTGWVRDDLISIMGDGTELGYPPLMQETLAFNLNRAADLPPAEPDRTEEGVGEDITPDVSTEEPTTETPPRIAGVIQGRCMGPSGVNIRSGPGTNHTVIGRFVRGHVADLLEAADSQSGEPLKWVRLRYQNREDGWVRVDFLRLSGDFESLGLGFADQYPSAAPQSHWIRDFDPTGSFLGVRHDGWDQAGTTGAPILGGPRGGLVALVANCSLCGPDGLSVEQKGLRVGMPQVFVPGWNFGYGHYVIVRYTHDQLPESTQRRLAALQRAGQHLFVMYAHLHQMMVQAGQELLPNQQIGTMGNSGNSTGTHLHLEVRASDDAKFIHWARIKPGLVSPDILYLR